VFYNRIPKAGSSTTVELIRNTASDGGCELEHSKTFHTVRLDGQDQQAVCSYLRKPPSGRRQRCFDRHLHLLDMCVSPSPAIGVHAAAAAGLGSQYSSVIQSADIVTKGLALQPSGEGNPKARALLDYSMARNGSADAPRSLKGLSNLAGFPDPSTQGEAFELDVAAINLIREPVKQMHSAFRFFKPRLVEERKLPPEGQLIDCV